MRLWVTHSTFDTQIPIPKAIFIYRQRLHRRKGNQSADKATRILCRLSWVVVLITHLDILSLTKYGLRVLVSGKYDCIAFWCTINQDKCINLTQICHDVSETFQQNYLSHNLRPTFCKTYKKSAVHGFLLANESGVQLSIVIFAMI